MSEFVDKVKVLVRAGKGGDGVIAWRRERFVDRGGPSGGDGGKGGDVIFKASRNINTLQGFRYRERLEAEPGESGKKQNKHGRKGEDLIVEVPVGTQIISGNELVGDLTEDGQTQVVARGGAGGFGNAHFKSSTRQAPRIAERGEPGEKAELTLELKLLADVSLIGLPNAGKSTLLSVISNARPEIADYPFTTLVPNLGVVDRDNQSILVADIPGLIEGASEGKGLGDDFLRHIERTALLVHLVDIYGDDIKADYDTITNELKEYKVDLSDKPRIVALSKIDGVGEKEVKAALSKLKKHSGLDTFAISSKSKDGLEALLREVTKRVNEVRAAEPEETPGSIKQEVITFEEDFVITKKTGHWVVKGAKIERFARRTDMNSPEGVERLKNVMRKMGIIKELTRLGAKAHEKIMIGEDELTL